MEVGVQGLRAAGRHRRGSTVRQAALVTAGWAAVVVVAPQVQASEDVHTVALFAHLSSLLLGFGAVLLVDWFGLLWLLRRRTLGDVLRTAKGAHVPTWLGFTGLLVSGALLAPAASPLTSIKLMAVLAVGLNGVFAGRLLTRLSRYQDRELPMSLLIRAGLATTLSQGAWWTAVVIGYLNSRS
jgi:hypothetical protein